MSAKKARPAVPAELTAGERDLERRAIAPMILARLLGSKAACDNIKARAAESIPKQTAPFAVLAARTAIEFANALIDELNAEAKREAARARALSDR
jgi:hypothetical protein